MGDLYCEQCGCRILAEWDVGSVRWRWESWGAGGRDMVRKREVICAACREEELEPVLTPAEAAIEAAFDRWMEQERRGDHGSNRGAAAHPAAHAGHQHAL